MTAETRAHYGDNTVKRKRARTGVSRTSLDSVIRKSLYVGRDVAPLVEHRIGTPLT